MGTPIVMVHTDQDYLREAASALRSTGYEVTALTSSFAALAALESADGVELLITGLHMAPCTPNGVSVALMARARHPRIKLLFLSEPQLRHLVEELGTCLPPHAPPSVLVSVVSELGVTRPAPQEREGRPEPLWCAPDAPGSAGPQSILLAR